MKKFKLMRSFLILFSLTLFSCGVDENMEASTVSQLNLKSKDYKTWIGKIIDGQPTITANKAELLKTWNNSMASLNRSLGTKLRKLKIKENADKDLILVASSKKHRSSRILLVENNDIFIYSIDGVSTTCTTISPESDTGCEAQRSGICSPCDGDCIKTTSITVDE